MSNKRKSEYYRWLGELSRHGWDADKAGGIHANYGSETAKHLHAKAATFRVLRAADYRVRTEVSHPERGEIDVVAIPTSDDQRPFAVELETNPTEEIISDKLDRYYEGTPFVECYVINLNDVPLHIQEMGEHISRKLGL